MTTLNAGCGDNTWGDVRIDVDPKSKAKTETMDIIDIKYPSLYFYETRCISVLEHIQDWKKAISELCRVTKGKLLIEVPVNSNIALTDIFRILIPTPKNISLFFSRRERASETYHQFNPMSIVNEIIMHGFYVKYRRIFKIYHSYPSRCWRFECKRVY